jgi:hypothetical protein
MAKQEVGLKIDVDVSSVGNMKQQLRAATNELVAMNEKFGSSSKEAIAAAQRVAGLKDAIGDAKALADTFNPDKKFVALGGAVQGAVSGFSALQGAMGLFGSESKDVEKLMLKVQSAMALQQGISGIAGAMDSMKLLGGTIKTQVVTAFSTLRGAIIATGLGALAVAVGLVIANFDKFKAAVFNLIPGLKGITDFVGGLVTKFTDFVGITSQAERNLEKLTKTNNRANQTIDDQIKLLEAQGGKEEQVYKLKKQRGENELNTLRENLKVKGKLSEDELKQFRDLKNGQQLLDIEEGNRKKKLSEDEAKRIESENEKKKQNQSKIDAENEKIRQENEAKKIAAENVLREIELKGLAERQRQEATLLDEFKKNKATLIAAGITNFLSLETQYQRDLTAIRVKFETEEADRVKKLQEEKLAKDKAIQEADINNKLAQFARIRKETQDNINAEKQREIDLQNFKIDTAQNTLSFLSNLVTSFGGESEKAGRRAFEQQKAISIAMAVIDTYKSANAIFAAAAANPKTILFPAQPFIAAGLAIAAGIANVAKISQQQYQSKNVPSPNKPGVGNLNAPLAPQLTPQVTATAVNTAAVNQMGNQATRAYVLNSDIQNNDQRNAYIDRNASIG